MNLFDWDEPCQVFILENLLIAKKLFDRGFDAARMFDIEAGNFELVAQILFGKENIKDEQFEPVLNPEQQLLLKEGAKLEEVEETVKNESELEIEEKALNLSEFMGFYHHRIEIKIPQINLLWSNQLKRLQCCFEREAYTLDEWERLTDFFKRYPYQNYLAGAGWLLDKNEKVGIWLHTVSTDYQEPWHERNTNELLIVLWDALRVARTFHLSRRSLKKRLILFSGGNTNSQNRKSGEVLASHLYQKSFYGKESKHVQIS